MQSELKDLTANSLVHAETWSPSSANTASSSSSSLSVSDMPTRTGSERRLRRRPQPKGTYADSSTCSLPESHSTTTSGPSNADQISQSPADPANLLGLIKSVAQQVDQASELKRMELKQARLKEKLGRKDGVKARVGRDRRPPTGNVRGGMKGKDKEEMRGMKGNVSPEVPTMQETSVSPMDVCEDEDSQRMPPPPTIPMRKLRSSSNAASSATSPVNFVSQTPLPPAYSKTIANSNTEPAPSRPEPLLDVQILVPPESTPAPPPVSVPKPIVRTKAPVLGMRRSPSLAPSPSQQRGLTPPLSQSRPRFKTPFAKPSAAASSGPLSTPVVPTANSLDTYSVTSVAQSNARRRCSTPASPRDIRPAQQKSGFTKLTVDASEADDSFGSSDYDMGIDDDELVRACSMYD